MRTCSALCGSMFGNCSRVQQRDRVDKSGSGPGCGEPAELTMKETES